MRVDADTLTWLERGGWGMGDGERGMGGWRECERGGWGMERV